MSGKLLLSTKKDAVLCNRPGYDMSALQPCNHPEADTRIFLHLAHAGANGHKKALVRTLDRNETIVSGCDGDKSPPPWTNADSESLQKVPARGEGENSIKNFNIYTNLLLLLSV